MGKSNLTGIVAATALAAGLAMAASAARAQAAANSNTAPNPYHEEVGWAKNAVGRPFGATGAIGIDRDGKSVWVFDRCGGATCEKSKIAPIMKFDSNGALLTALGSGLFNAPHGFFADKDGFLWVTDFVGGNGKGHTVMKLDQTGKVLMTLGKPGVAGDGPDEFNAPSDVLVAPSGHIFVADGHGGKTNGRIVEFANDGKFIKTWGKPGKETGEFDTPHKLAMDSQGRLFVADRGNSRLQIFDQDGKFLAEWKQFGRPSSVFIDKHDVIYVADSQSSDKTNPGFQQGIRVGDAKTGEITAFIPETKQLGALEGVAADDAGNVYGGYTNTMDFKRFVKN